MKGASPVGARMRVTEDRVVKLKELGLTESQARAYLALLDLGASTVGQVSQATGLPRTRLYEVFTDLQRVGLVDFLSGEPMRYCPRTLEGHLGRRLEALEQERARLVAGAQVLLQEFALPDCAPSVDGRTQVFQGRRNAMLHVAELLAQSRASLSIACTRRTVSRFAAAGLDRVVAERAGQGLVIELIVPGPPDVRGLLGDLPEGAVVVYFVPAPSPMEVLIGDDRHCVAWVPRPDDADVTRGDDEGIASSSAAVKDLLATSLRGFRAAPEASVAAKTRPKRSA